MHHQSDAGIILEKNDALVDNPPRLIPQDAELNEKLFSNVICNAVHKIMLFWRSANARLSFQWLSLEIGRAWSQSSDG